jgi:hypothetical protein
MPTPRTPKAKKVIAHPSTEKRRRAAMSKWLELQKRHRLIERALWTGTVALHFTDDELTLIPSYLCESDIQHLRKAGRFGVAEARASAKGK